MRFRSSALTRASFEWIAAIARSKKLGSVIYIQGQSVTSLFEVELTMKMLHFQLKSRINPSVIALRNGCLN